MAKNVEFEVKDTGEIQKVEMKDGIPAGRLIIKKSDAANHESIIDIELEYGYNMTKITDWSNGGDRSGKGVYRAGSGHYFAESKGVCLEPAGGMELAAATVRGLFLTVSHRDTIGPLYPQVLDTLVRGVCQRLFPEDG